MRLDERVALVTGSGSGIGRATAMAFAAAGASVIVSDLDEAAGGRVVDAIRDSDGDAIFVRCDVSKSEDVARLVGEAVKAFEKIDFAVNNAGVEGTRGKIADVDEAAFRHTIDVNVMGVFYCMKRELEVMVRQNRGAIVNLASIYGLVAAQSASAYITSKHAVVGLTRAAALEYAAQNIRVNAVCPGYVETPMVMERGLSIGNDPEAREKLLARIPVGRLAKPEEIAQSILWLCSDECAYVTGHTLAVDGGYVVR